MAVILTSEPEPLLSRKKQKKPGHREECMFEQWSGQFQLWNQVVGEILITQKKKKKTTNQLCFFFMSQDA